MKFFMMKYDAFENLLNAYIFFKYHKFFFFINPSLFGCFIKRRWRDTGLILFVGHRSAIYVVENYRRE